MKKSIKGKVYGFVKGVMFKAVYPFLYQLSRLRPADKSRVVFAEIRSGVLTDSYRYIYDALSSDKSMKPIVYYVHNNKGGMGYLLRYIKLIFLMGNAGCVLCDDTCNLFGAFRFRKETKVIQTWHSCGAFKKWGESITDLSFGESLDELRKYPAHKNYDLVTVSSEECVWAFKEAFGFDEKNTSVKPIGVSRTDWFFREENIKSAFDTLYDTVAQAKEKKVILYAPTYRGDADKAYIPEKLDIKRLAEEFSDDYVLLIKRHGFVNKPWDIPAEYKDFAVDVTGDITIEQLLCTADVCITDYSSLIFEYSLFDKPMIFYAFDLDSFYDYRGFYYKYDKDFLPGEIVFDNDGLIDELHRSKTPDYKRIKAFREKFMGACDGHSTDRIVNYIRQ